MQLPIDRRAAVGSLAGAALGYGLSTAARGQTPESVRAIVQPVRVDGGAAMPSVRDAGAKGDGIAMDGAAIQAALDRFDSVWVPPGVYVIDEPLTLPSFRVLAFSADAVFCPARDGMTIFRTGEVSYSTRVIAPRVHARGKRDVTAFDLQGFRHRAELQHVDIEGCARGIVLRELCWDTVIHMPWIRQTALPIIIGNGSNAVDIVHPGLDDFDVGVTLRNGGEHTTTSARIWGGYVQNGRCGIIDEGCFGTVVDGTYFEGLKDADIVLARAVRSNISRTQHYGEVGRAAIRMTSADGATVFDPLMTSGARSVGLYDIDAGSRNVTRFDSLTAGGVNGPIGNVGSSGTLIREERGAFQPMLVTTSGASARYTKREGRWRRAQGELSIALDLAWSGAQPGGLIAIGGLPAGVMRGGAPVAAFAPAIVRGSGGTSAFARLGDDGVLRLVMVEGGRESAVPLSPDGAVSISLTCLI